VPQDAQGLHNFENRGQVETKRGGHDRVGAREVGMPEENEVINPLNEGSSPWYFKMAMVASATLPCIQPSVAKPSTATLLAGALGVQDSTRLSWDSLGFGLWFQLICCTNLLTLSGYFK